MKNLQQKSDCEVPPFEGEPCLCFLSVSELEAHHPALSIGRWMIEDFLRGSVSKFESHEGFDYISLVIPNPGNPLGPADHLCLIFRQDLLVICSNDLDRVPVIKALKTQLQKEMEESDSFSLERILQLFFDRLTYEDALFLESIEEEISILEEALITAKTRNYIAEIVQLRKKLLAYKRYYDQLASISSAIEENQNNLLSGKEVRFFRILTNRVDRLVSGVNSLQDYVSQVREAFQTQTDINQNRIMKLFTVITAIFLPLTLIVGWYGMNVQMPEYGWRFGYPFVAILCAIVAIFSILYFKKNKWF